MNEVRGIQIEGRPGDENSTLVLYTDGKSHKYPLSKERLLWLQHTVSARLLEMELKRNLTEP